MNIKNEEALARHMGLALMNYANQVQNGAVKPFRKFLEGKDTVNVAITLTGDCNLQVEEITEKPIVAEAPKPEPEFHRPSTRRKQPE